MPPDIAVNLTDPMYQGQYHGKNRHQPDIEAVVGRARDAGVEKILITGTSLSESRETLSMAKRFSMYAPDCARPERRVLTVHSDLHCTAGCHPTSTSEMDKYEGGAEAYVRDLNRLIEEDRGEGGSKRIRSVGEIGLGRFLFSVIRDMAV